MVACTAVAWLLQLETSQSKDGDGGDAMSTLFLVLGCCVKFDLFVSYRSPINQSNESFASEPSPVHSPGQLHVSRKQGNHAWANHIYARMEQQATARSKQQC